MAKEIERDRNMAHITRGKGVSTAAVRMTADPVTRLLEYYNG